MDSRSNVRRVLTRLLALGAIIVIPAQAHADRLYLLNGDRITGVVTEAAKGSVRLKTEYAGELSIPLAQIEAIETDAEIELHPLEGEPFSGQLRISEGQQRVVSDGVERPIALTDIARIGAPPKVKKWSGAIDLGATARSGATDTIDANAGAQFMRKGEDNTLTLEMSAAYGEVESDVNVRRYKGQGKWQFYPSDRFYYYGLAGAEHDPARKLDLRLDFAAGAGYDFIENERRALSADLGLAYQINYWLTYDLVGERRAKEAARNANIGRLEAYFRNFPSDPNPFSPTNRNNTLALIRAYLEDPVVNETTRADNYSLRATASFKQTLFKNSTFSERIVFNPDLEDIGRFHAESDMALVTPLTKQVDLKLSWQALYEGRAEEVDLENWEHTFLTSLRYKF